MTAPWTPPLSDTADSAAALGAGRHTRRRRWGAAPFYARSKSVLMGMMRCTDLALIALMALLAYWLRHGVLQFPPHYGIAVIIAMMLAWQVFQAAGLYETRNLGRLIWQLSRLTTALTLVAMGLLAIAFFTKTAEEYSRAWVATWIVGVWLALAATRIAAKLRLRAWQRSGWLTRRVAIVGADNHSRRLFQHLHRDGGDAGIAVIGVFDDRKTRVSPYPLGGFAVTGGLDDLIDICRNDEIDDVLIALPWRADNRLMEIAKRLRQVPVDVRLAPEPIGFRLNHGTLQDLAGLPMLTVFKRPLAGWHQVIKLMEDKLLGGLILLLVSPLMLLLALAIKLDSPGPVFFRQERYGFNNNLITVWKFRTMRHRPAAADGDSEVVQATRNDPRVTRLGALLRRTSLDELPQFFNVLGGSMSIVGPRPHAVAHNVQFAGIVNQYYARHRVKPGITGWAQVNGLRGETDTPEKLELRLEHDLYYIDNWSLWLDLKIIVMTVFVGLVHKHAY